MTSRRAAAAESKASASSCSRRCGSAGAENTMTLRGSPAMAASVPAERAGAGLPAAATPAHGGERVDDAVAVEPVALRRALARGGERARGVERVRERLLRRARRVRRRLLEDPGDGVRRERQTAVDAVAPAELRD